MHPKYLVRLNSSSDLKLYKTASAFAGAVFIFVLFFFSLYCQIFFSSFCYTDFQQANETFGKGKYRGFVFLLANFINRDNIFTDKRSDLI